MISNPINYSLEQKSYCFNCIVLSAENLISKIPSLDFLIKIEHSKQYGANI